MRRRIAFMGTPEFAATALGAIIAAGHEVMCVYSQPPRPRDRGQKPLASAVHQLAEQQGIAVRHPVNFKDAADVAAFAALDLDVAVVAAYGLILPRALLDAPRFGCLNIHASLLPRWRGAAPIHRAILAGDSETGIGIMQMEAGLDTGPVLLEARTPILPTDTTGQLHDRLANMGGDLICAALDQLETLTPRVQANDGITYAAKIAKAESRIDWSMPATGIDAKVRAFNPFPGAFTELDGVRIRILEGVVETACGPAGTTVDDQLTIACGRGSYRITRLQKAGKGALDAADFLRGQAIPAGKRFP